MTDAQVLDYLADLFNTEYSADGYTATYDEITINQQLPSVDINWSADSDTGLFFDDSVADAPEPSSLLLLGTGLAGLVSLLRRRQA
jgi:hypothetical protein